MIIDNCVIALYDYHYWTQNIHERLVEVLYAYEGLEVHFFSSCLNDIGNNKLPYDPTENVENYSAK
jgi:hypothetical protein